MTCPHCKLRSVHARGRCTTCLWHAYKDPTFAQHQKPGGLCTRCSEPAHALGLCQNHYMQAYRRTRRVVRLPRLCSIDGCDKRHYGWGYCEPHYRRAKRMRKVAA